MNVGGPAGGLKANKGEMGFQGENGRGWKDSTIQSSIGCERH